MNISNNTEEYTKYQTKLKQPPTFKGGVTSMLNLSGNVMQSIEKSGFLGSFLIQDGCGMTVPRTTAGFLRDKEETGKYNMQEGIEVLGREGLTGPCMMAVAPILLLIAAKFGKTTSVNSAFIKRYGNSLKEMISNASFDKDLLNNAEKFKEEFYKKNLRQMLEDTLGVNNAKSESIEFIINEIKHIEKIPAGTKLKRFRGKSKYRDECYERIISHINDIMLKTSSDLDMLEKIKFGSDKLDSKKVFSTRNAIDAMIKYSDDAIIANKHLNKLDEIQADKIRNESLAKRLITNITMIASTLGVLSVLPKIYARSNVAPGARTKQENSNLENNNITFKGKSNFNILEKIGKKLNKIKSDFVHNELEYNGHNFTNTLMAGLSIFGLLTPRIARAYNRAEVDENGKKDLTELWEILIRDVSSSLAVVFAVPMLTRMCVTSYEKNSGFVLIHKDRTPKTKLQIIKDLINPYSKSHVLTNSEINSLYNNVNTKDKMVNFCKYIDKNNGDLQKILSKSENANLIFNDKNVSLSNIKNLDKKTKNKKILHIVENLKGENIDKIIEQVMQVASKGKKSPITAFARGLTSLPGLLTTFLISPYLLGWFIPRLTYANTRRIHEKQELEKINKQTIDTKTI